jgi:RHS repeat-associated protein
LEERVPKVDFSLTLTHRISTMKTAVQPTLKAHLWRFAFIAFSLLGVHQNLQAKESSGMQWTVTRHTWGEDLSGSLQGAGGIGGLLSSTVDGSPTKNKEQRTTNGFHYDSNGNVILLTNAKAQETARYSYDAFGKTLTATGPAAEQNRYQFSTKPVEEKSGLVYYGYRWYDPLTGRWPSRDPIGERGGVNLFAFVGNGSVGKTDRLGLALTKAQCDTAIQLGTQGGLAAQIVAELQTRNGEGHQQCKVPQFTCEACAYSCPVAGKPRGGDADPLTGKIRICHDLESLTVAKVASFVLHELVHLLDTCDGADWSNCEHRACAEIRAYTTQRLGLPDHEIKSLAATSTSADEACAADSAATVERMWARCSTTNPFDDYDGPN